MSEPAQDVPGEPIQVGQPRSPFKKFFLRGIVLLLPTIITVWILVKIVGFLHENVIQYVAELVAWGLNATGLLGPEAYQIVDGKLLLPPTVDYLTLAIAWLVSLGLVALIGMVFGGFVGHRIWLAVEGSLMRLPPIRFVYPYVKQVTEFLFTKQTLGFRQVVAVEYPRKGLLSLGFVTGKAMPQIDAHLNADCLSIFVPSSPTPMTGYLIFVPETEVIYIPMSIDDALKITVSGGVIKPDLLKRAGSRRDSSDESDPEAKPDDGA